MDLTHQYSECNDCPKIETLHGCAGDVPFILKIDRTETPYVLTFTNIETGVSSTTPPASFSLDCDGSTGTVTTDNTYKNETAEVLCDINGAVSTPIQVIKHYENGAYVSQEYRNLDGTPYTLTGTLGLCNPATTTTIQDDHETVESILCDKVGGNYQPVKVITKLLNGVITTTEYFDKTGAPYIVQGELIDCNRDNCNNPVIKELLAGESITIPASGITKVVSVVVLDGTLEAVVGSDTVTGLPVGYSSSWESNSGLTDDLRFTSSGRVIVTGITCGAEDWN
jgi:hypothetical protein